MIVCFFLHLAARNGRSSRPSDIPTCFFPAVPFFTGSLSQKHQWHDGQQQRTETHDIQNRSNRTTGSSVTVLQGDIWLNKSLRSSAVLVCSTFMAFATGTRRALSHTFHSALYRRMASCAQTGSLRPVRSRSLDLMPRTCWWLQPCKRYGSTLPMLEGKADMVTFSLVPGVVFGCFVLRQAEETNRARPGQDRCWVPERSTISP